MDTQTKAVSESIPQVRLRTMESADVQALFCMENDPEVWRYTDQGDAPYTWEQIKHFVHTAPRDLTILGQLRLVIESEGRVVGTVDWYGYDPDLAQAWVGVLVWPAELRGRGVGRAALRQLLHQVDQGQWPVERLLAQVDPENQASLRLFRSVGFQETNHNPNGPIVLERSRHCVLSTLPRSR